MMAYFTQVIMILTREATARHCHAPLFVPADLDKVFFTFMIRPAAESSQPFETQSSGSEGAQAARTIPQRCPPFYCAHVMKERVRATQCPPLGFRNL